MVNKASHTELRQKVKDLERELNKYKRTEKAKWKSEREELLCRRVEELAVRRIHSHFAIFGVIVSALAILGFLGFGKYLEYTLSDSISRDVKDAAKKEIGEVSQLVSKKVESEINKLEQGLKSIENRVEDARKRAERTQMEAEVNLESTMKRIEHMGRLLVGDVERRRHGIISEVREEYKKFEGARKTAEKESKEIVDRIRAELGNLEKLTAVVRSPLREKISILRTLTLDRSSTDADIQRYIAILVLKEMEDVELVRRENAKEEARQVISELLAKYGLGGEFFAEVRLRILRAVAELGFVGVASKQVLDPKTWDRGNLILLLGALRDGEAMPCLAKIVKNTKEPLGFRKMAVRSLVFIRANSRVRPKGIPWIERPAPKVYSPIWEIGIDYPTLRERLKRWEAFEIPSAHEVRMLSPHQVSDPEIEAMLPRTSRFFRFGTGGYTKSLTTKQLHLAADALSSVLSDRREPIDLRIATLKALKLFGNVENIDTVKRVLFNEWKNFGEDAIDFFVMVGEEKSVFILREFALNDRIDKCLRLRCIIGLAKTGKPSALTALTEISKKDPQDVICAAANMAVSAFDDRSKWFSGYPISMVSQGWLGIAIQKVTREVKDELKLKDEKGALVAKVFPDSPAEKTGIKIGDVIVAFDGKDIEEANELPYIVALTPAGKKVIVTVIRKGKSKNIKVQIGKPKKE